ncbi:spaetzle domain-containing protein [Nephila pilipes]|uniref:Spaetzle domain-containing protein n=1 Tax=Nephila pilipes TaxID=299642 RepID=A0A8X6JKD8_NEPPI|nr:spaetzle domain-containing protein [Nephila pilipes]
MSISGLRRSDWEKKSVSVYEGQAVRQRKKRVSGASHLWLPFSSLASPTTPHNTPHLIPSQNSLQTGFHPQQVIRHLPLRILNRITTSGWELRSIRIKRSSRKMGFSSWILMLLVIASVFSDVLTFDLAGGPPPTPSSPNYAAMDQSHRLRRVASESGSFIRYLQPPPVYTQPIQPLTTSGYKDPIKRGGPPFVFIHPMTMSKRPRTSRRLVLTLPKDNVHILNADAVPEKGQQFLPTTLTLSLRDNDSEESNKGSLRYTTTRSYASQIPSPPSLASRYHYGFPASYQGDSDEEDRSNRKPGRFNKGEVSYELDDLMGSSGGQLTVIKAHSAAQPKIITARKVMSGGSSFKPMKAILIEPKEIEAKRVHVMEANAEKVSATKARIIASPESTIATGYKVKAHPISYKKGIVSKSKGEDWAASRLHYVKTEAPQESSARNQDEDVPAMELQCGGTNDLGWCDLGANYPSAEVSQIMEVCEELVSHMFIEIPENSEPMEDIASYSLSRNITDQGFKPYWPWKSHSPNYKKSLCEIKRDFIRPSFAQDMKGKWHVIIQTDAIPQRIALEVCKKPGEPCNSNELCNNSNSQCVQKYTHHQLISFDPESAETCPYVRLYKFPTSCVCRIA